MNVLGPPERVEFFAFFVGAIQATVPASLEGMVRERAAGNDTAVLTAPINIGVGTK